MRWANAMFDRGHCVTVVSCPDHRPDDKVEYNEGVEIILLKHRSGFGYYFNARQLKKIVKSRKFDVINVHYASGYGTLGRMAGLKNSLLNIWGSDVYVYPYESKINFKIIKKNLRYYNYVASTSHCMAKQAASLVDRKYYITPFGVDTNRFKPVRAGCKNGSFVVGTVKTLSPIYGIEDSIKAFNVFIKRLKQEGMCKESEKIIYEIYGRGESAVELQSLINELNLENNVKLCGYVQNGKLPEIYNNFDVFICNSLSESFGVAAVEAMACGVPVVVSDADGFKEVVEDNVTGFVVPRGDVEATANGIYKLYKNSVLRKSFGEEGVKRVESLYNWDCNVSTMENIYKDIIEG